MTNYVIYICPIEQHTEAPSDRTALSEGRVTVCAFQTITNHKSSVFMMGQSCG